jgi:hypothetical protein
MAVFDYLQGTGATCPQRFRPLNRSLGLYDAAMQALGSYKGARILFLGL